MNPVEVARCTMCGVNLHRSGPIDPWVDRDGNGRCPDAVNAAHVHDAEPRETRTGAPYLHFEAWLCPEEHGGCGVVEVDVEDDDGALLPVDDGWREDNPDTPEPEYRCPNCRHAPLARVSITTADRIASP